MYIYIVEQIERPAKFLLWSVLSSDIVLVQPIADRVAQNLEIISKRFPTDQNSAHGIDD